MNNLSIYLHFHHKKHLIFDFGNTLFFHDFRWEQLTTQIKDYAAEFSAEVVEQYKHDTPALVSVLIDRYGPKVKTTIDNMWAQFELAHLDQLKPNQDLIEFIINTNHLYTMHIWSSNSKAMIQTLLEGYDLRKYFSQIISRDDVSNSKPNPEGFYLLNQKLALPLDNFLFIGDSPTDQIAAEKAQIDYFSIEPDGEI